MLHNPVLFKSLGILTAPIWGEDYYEHPEFYDFQDKVDELKKDADVIRVFLKDGETRFLAKANFNFGQCNCCDKIKFQDVLRFEALKWEPNYGK